MKNPFAPFQFNAHRFIQDPVHGTIALSRDESAIIDHPFLQRLRNIRQLGNASLVFPAATHSRFSHSLGVMHQAGELCQAIFTNGFLNKAKKPNRRTPTPGQVDAALGRLFGRVRLAGLLHDLGHGPYSHHFELFLNAEEIVAADLQQTDFRIPLSWIAPALRETYLKASIHHEHFSYGLIHLLPLPLGERRAILALLDSRFTCGPEMESDLRIVAAKGGLESAWPSLLQCLRSLLSSDIDADRMDYLKRDSHFCGVRLGIDTDHLLRSASLYLSKNRFVIHVERNALFAIEQMLLARKQMFSQVYQNRVNQLLDEVLSQAMEHCRKKKLINAPKSVPEFLQMDDQWLYEKLRNHLSACLASGQKMNLGDIAVAMYITRTLPVTEAVQDVRIDDLEKVTRKLKREHKKGTLLCIPQKELMAREKRTYRFAAKDRHASLQEKKQETVLFTAHEKGGELFPITEVSELIQSTAWYEPRFRVIVTKSLEESATVRQLNEKLRWFPKLREISTPGQSQSYTRTRAQRA